MASQLGQFGNQLLGVGRSLLSWSQRLTKYLRHRMLTQRKNVLLLGDQRSPLYNALHPLLATSWEIVHIAEAQQQSTPFEQTTPEVQGSAEEKSLSVDKNKFFRRLYLEGQNYAEIEKQLEGKQFDSIVVLPPVDDPAKQFQLDTYDFATSFPQVHEEALMRSVFAYRLASRCLTSSGVLILSISEHDFLKEERKEGAKAMFSSELVDGQVSYLGVVVGDRDHTDLNSWSVTALSKEMAVEDAGFVAGRYKIWADSQQLPMPGTFALFRRKSETSNAHHVQFL